MARLKLTGIWQGRYAYDPSESYPQPGPEVSFGMSLKQSWLFRDFIGEIWEDPPNGMPGRGRIEGRLSRGKITFLKWMPFARFRSDEGSMTLKEYVEKTFEMTVDENPPHPVLRYEGEFNAEMEQFEGTWSFVQVPTQFQSK